MLPSLHHSGYLAGISAWPCSCKTTLYKHQWLCKHHLRKPMLNTQTHGILSVSWWNQGNPYLSRLLSTRGRCFHWPFLWYCRPWALPGSHDHDFWRPNSFWRLYALGSEECCARFLLLSGRQNIQSWNELSTDIDQLISTYIIFCGALNLKFLCKSWLQSLR